MSQVCTFCSGGEDIIPFNKTLHLSEYTSCHDAQQQAANIFNRLDSMECRVLQTVGALCGCPTQNDGCQLCSDGSPVGQPQKMINFIQNDTFGFVPDCEFQQAYLTTISHNESACQDQLEGIEAISSHCGCPSIPTEAEDPCPMCLHPVPQESLQKHLDFLDTTPDYTGPPQGLEETCEYVEARSVFVESYFPECLEVYRRGIHCGCNGGWYNPDGSANAEAGVIVMIVPAVLSAIGSIAVLWDILRSKEKLKRVYHQIMLGMVIFDLLTSLAYMFGPPSVPRYWRGDPTLLFGARGTVGTCYIQAFVMHLGMGTIYYNVSLAVYYKLVIVHNWRAERLNKWRIWFHVIPSTIALVLTLGAIPFYGPFFQYCFVEFSGEDSSNTFYYVVTSTVYGPVTISISALTILTLQVLWSVYLNVRRSGRWSFRRRNMSQAQAGSRNNAPATQNALVMKVFWQSLWYVIAFYVIWPYNLWIASAFNSNPAVGFMFVAIFLLPLQGFLNALVYFRPRMKRWFTERAERAATRKRDGGTAPLGVSGGMIVTRQSGMNDSGDEEAVAVANGSLAAEVTDAEIESVDESENELMLE